MRNFKQLARNDLCGDFSFLKHIPNLTDFQNESFERFLQYNCDPKSRKNQGLEQVFRNFFPMSKPKIPIVIDYLYYSIDKPKYTPDECLYRNCSYASTINAYFLIKNTETNEQQEIKSCLGEFPLITDYGTFIHNGNERVFCSHLVKCPGIIFSYHKHTTGFFPMAKILPNIGSWIYIYIEKNVFYVSIDKKKKFHYSTFLLCFPKNINNFSYQNDKKITDNQILNDYYTKEEILNQFYKITTAKWDGKYWNTEFNGSNMIYTPLSYDLHINEILIQNAGEKPHKDLQMHSGIVQFTQLKNIYIAEQIFDENGLLLLDIGQKITDNTILSLKQNREFKFFILDDYHSDTLLNTFVESDISNAYKALQVWSNIMKIGLHNNVTGIAEMFNLRFFNIKYYNLDEIGRIRLNDSLNENEESKFLTMNDLIGLIKELVLLNNGKRKPDDIDNCANKRVKSVGEILESIFRLGIIKLEKNIHNRIQLFNFKDSSGNVDIVNCRMLFEFDYALSQMFDNNNRISQISQERKLIFPISRNGGQKNVSDNARDINHSECGRICPATTPEGKKTGLVENMALYGKIDKYGFICTPYYIVNNGVITEEIQWINPLKEKNKVIGSREDLLNSKNDIILGRLNGEEKFFHKNEINFVNIATNQIFSVSASLIPFIQNTECYRGTTASNMISQATPLVKKQPPFVSTGMDKILADMILAKRSGFVKKVDCRRIVIETDEGFVDFYEFPINKRTNADTVITYKPSVRIGDYIKEGDPIIDGFCTTDGELALGTNVLICFCTYAQSFEDSFIGSYGLIKRGVLTSNNVQMIECHVIETRFGPEKVTKDIPNIDKQRTEQLDEVGIVKIGSIVVRGTILVGKVTPSGQEKDTSREKNLLCCIFGGRVFENANTSLVASHNMEGIVTDVHILNRKDAESDDRSMIHIKKSIDDVINATEDKISILLQILLKNVNKLLESHIKEPLKVIKKSTIESLNISGELKSSILNKIDHYTKLIDEINNEKQAKINSLKSGYILEDNIIKIIRIFVTKRQSMEPGDKLCGRYGNKGVLSIIQNECDMPYMKDGTPVEIIASPSSIIARMNLGQIWETSLGYVLLKLRKAIAENLYSKNYEKLKSLLELAIGKNNKNVVNLDSVESLEQLARHYIKNGIYVRVPQFQDIDQQILIDMMKSIGDNNLDLKEEVFDGRTGEKLNGKVLCGYMYMFALCHYVDKKMHVRSVGPYSLVTLQPLGGKARNGGQKVGEMEVWAIEAHGGAFNCLELGVKSDDPIGKRNVYSDLSKGLDYSISIKSAGKNNCVMGNFKLLVFELRAAGFDLKIFNNDKEISLVRRKWWGF